MSADTITVEHTLASIQHPPKDPVKDRKNYFQLEVLPYWSNHLHVYVDAIQVDKDWEGAWFLTSLYIPHLMIWIQKKLCNVGKYEESAAQFTALQLALRKILQLPLNESRILFFTKHDSVLRRLHFALEHYQEQFYKQLIIDDIKALRNSGKTVAFAWVPAELDLSPLRSTTEYNKLMLSHLYSEHIGENCDGFVLDSLPNSPSEEKSTENQKENQKQPKRRKRNRSNSQSSNDYKSITTMRADVLQSLEQFKHLLKEFTTKHMLAWVQRPSLSKIQNTGSYFYDVILPYWSNFVHVFTNAVRLPSVDRAAYQVSVFIPNLGKFDRESSSMSAYDEHVAQFSSLKFALNSVLKIQLKGKNIVFFTKSDAALVRVLYAMNHDVIPECEKQLINDVKRLKNKFKIVAFAWIPADLGISQFESFQFVNQEKSLSPQHISQEEYFYDDSLDFKNFEDENYKFKNRSSNKRGKYRV